jgi:L-ascorbate metabolism protein UlaG (beta-lactamase superfamily)
VIAAFQKDDALLSDIEHATAAHPDALHLWWLGQSGFLAIVGEKRVVFDPYLSDSLTTKYARTDKPHVRMTERVLAPERLHGIDLITSTHNHTDHLDAETLLPLLAANPGARLVLPAANAAFAVGRLGEGIRERLVPMAIGEMAHIDGLSVRAVPAAHEALSPEFCGFVVTIGAWTIYHSGDTVPFEGMAPGLAPLGIDIALLPINGRGPERRVAGNLWGDEAAALAQGIGARLAIPCHFEMFAFNTAPPDAFVAACIALGTPYAVLRAGERLSRLGH